MNTENFHYQHFGSLYAYHKTPHFHDLNEMLFTMNDDAIMLVNEHSFVVERGSVFLIPQGTLHQKINTGSAPVDTHVIHYPTSLLTELSTPSSDLYQAYAGTTACLHLKGEVFDKLFDQFNRMSADNTPQFGRDLHNILVFAEILVDLYPQLDLNVSSEKRFYHDDPQLQPILSYIDHHLTEPLSLEAIAESLYTNKYTLCHLFKRKTGMTITAYINSSRIKYASILLRQALPIKEIAQLSGFSSQEHFIRVFREHVGMTPGKYSRKLREDNNIHIPYNVYQPDAGAPKV